MESAFSVPVEFRESFQRLYPYMPAFLRNDDQAQEAIYLYLKLGGEKLARCAIDAFIQTHRLKSAEAQKRLLVEAMLAEQNGGVSENGDEEGTDEDGADDVDIAEEADF